MATYQVTKHRWKSWRATTAATQCSIGDEGSAVILALNGPRGRMATARPQKPLKDIRNNVSYHGDHDAATEQQTSYTSTFATETSSCRLCGLT